MKHRLLIVPLLLVCWAAGPPLSAARTPLWELTLQDHEDLPLGQSAGATGAASPEGVRFMLKNVSVDQPIQATLVSESEKDDLKLLVYKDTWDSPLLEGSTGAEGVVTFRFRTGDHAAFKVTGPPGKRYQLFVWVGPVFQFTKPAPFMAMSEFTAQHPSDESGPPSADTLKDKPAEETGTPMTPDRGGDRTLHVLLIVIALILTVIAVLLYRGQRGRKGSALIPALILAGLLAAAAVALAQEASPSGEDPDLKPRPLTVKETWERTNRAVQELRDQLDRFPETGKKEVDDMIAGTKLMFTFLEHFGLIDRREAAVQPDYNPDGIPPLPSRCFEDPTGKCAACFSEAHDRLQKWHRLLEDQWAIYRRTMLEAGRIIELADAAAGLSAIAKFKWAVDKANPNDPVNQSKARFFSDYDKNYHELIKRLNEALIAIGRCEFDHYSDRDWYNRYGMPYYLFMRDRYKRPE